MTTQSATLPTGIRFIGLALNQGVYRSHMLTFYLACYAAIMLATFVPQTQPFLLEEVLQMDPSRQGVVSGNDDSRPLRDRAGKLLTGGGLPAQIWRDFMRAAHATPQPGC